jgi:hypothetical protein
MPADDELFGQIVLRSKMIKQHQLAKALTIQESMPKESRKKLGEILVAGKLLKPVDVRNILHVQALMRAANPNIQFIMDVIQHEYATEEQVRDCLKTQQREGYRRHVGDVMVERGILSHKLKNQLMEEVVVRHGDGSKLVETIRRAELGDAHSPHVLALQEAQLDDAKKFIKEGVYSILHLGIISHMVHRQWDSYTLKQIVAALEEDKNAIQAAIEDLLRIKVLTEEKTWLSTRYRFCTDANIRQRVEILLLCANDPEQRKEIFSMLLRKSG